MLLIDQFSMKVDVPVSSLALQSLVEASSGSMDHGWEVGWALASHESGPQPFMDVGQTQVSKGYCFSRGLSTSNLNQ
jgi:hypothetical protein